MILSQCLNVVPPGFTGDLTQIGPRDAWWAARGVGKVEMLAGDKNGTNYAASCLKDLGSKKGEFVADIEVPEETLEVPKIVAALRAINYKTIPTAPWGSVDARATRRVKLYNWPSRTRSPWGEIDGAIMRGNHDACAAITAELDEGCLSAYVWKGEPVSDQVRRMTMMAAEWRRIAPGKQLTAMLQVTCLDNATAPIDEHLREDVTTATFEACRDAGYSSVILYAGNGRVMNGTEGWYVATQKWLGRN